MGKVFDRRELLPALVVVIVAFGGGPSLHAAGAVLYVDASAVGLNNGTSWPDAYTNLQDATTAAVSGDEIWVAQGVYRPTTTMNRGTPFGLKDGVATYGGFAGDETARTQRDHAGYPTILSGDIGIIGVLPALPRILANCGA